MVVAFLTHPTNQTRNRGDMTSCYFYALDEDRLAIVRFIFDNTDCKIYESNSRNTRTLPSYDSFDDFMAGRKKDIRYGQLRFDLHAPSMKGKIKFERSEWEEKPRQRAGSSFTVHGWGLIQLNFGGLDDCGIDRSDVGGNSEKRALNLEGTYRRSLGPVSDWDWKAVYSISSKICRFVRKTAVDKVQGKPVLPAVHKLVSEGKAELRVY
jgi:hypothetical protein